ncbi:hypothetical protein AB1L30_00125, partial [Bremerella sp. JC817]|uniref:hypothetical protein n=1 Tax=Bremerella sp. JC817 TaxID=3231756 RepID=UPI003457D654
DGKPLEETFGTTSADWFWHDGGVVDIENETVTLRLKDLTGFDGRCDAIYDGKSFPNDRGYSDNFFSFVEANAPLVARGIPADMRDHRSGRASKSAEAHRNERREDQSTELDLWPGL